MTLGNTGLQGWIKYHAIPFIVRTGYGDFAGAEHLLQNNYNLYGIKEIITDNNIIYKATPEALLTVPQSIREYDYSDLRKTDIVLDIGACVGGFSLNVAKYCRHVFAVEPIFYDQLAENIQCNNIKNITVIKGALGKKRRGMQQISFKGSTNNSIVYTLKDLITLCGGSVQFLKCDIEGDEKFIELGDLLGIRRIEMEVHEIQEEWAKNFRAWLNKNYENIRIDPDGNNMALIHAGTIPNEA